MKKNFFLSLVLAVLCTATSWAQFSPQSGKIYAMKEVTSGLFLDIQTGVYDGNKEFSNCLSLSTDPCVIYFVAGTTDASKWTMKNVNGEYVMQGSKHWIVRLGETAYEWAFADVDSDGYYTIARADGKFIGADNTTAGVCLYCDRGTGLEFALVEYTDLVDTHKYTTFKASRLTGDTRTDDTYLSMTAPSSQSTQVSFKTEPTEFHIIPSAGASILMQRGSEPAKYLAESTSNYWDAAISGTPYCWVISAEDADGYVSITKLSNNGHRVGHDTETTAGTGVFVNVGTDCNKWMLAETNIYSATVPTFTNEISTITSYGQYLTRLAIDGVGVYSGGAPSTIDDMYVETPVTGISLEPGVEYTMNLTFPKNQTSQILSAVIWFDKNGDGVYETHLGTTGTADSNNNDISTVRFTVPADASQLLTRIRLRLDSSWGIKNEPDAAANRMVYDIPVIIAEAPTYTFHIENPSGQDVNVTYDGNAIKDGDEVTGVINAGYVSASDIEGYTRRVVVNSNEKTITLVYVKKYSLHIVGAPNGVTLTYNGNEIGEGYYFDAEFDLTQFVVNNLPEGYSWEVSKNTKGKFVVVTFTALVTVENPAAVVALIKRIGGDGVEDKFKFVLEPSLNYNQEIFVIGGEDGKVLIKGTTISAITTGIGWYLQNIAHINIAWNSLNEKTVSGDAYADLSNIPVPTAEETHASDAMYRYYLNTCVFGYSMTTWTWKRWQQEIDWMALHGVNMPLQLVGLEEVWRKFLTMEEGGKRKYGYTDEAAKAFVPGPAFIAWWAMNNLQGWGGTAKGTDVGANNGNNSWDGSGGVQDNAWYARQKALAKQITDRQRELGMQPVLPGWSGMVPANFASISGYATRANGGWNGGFVRPLLLNVSNANYAEIAADYYACLHEVMGESQYYSMDPFHEGGGAGTMEDYEALYAAMEAAKPGSQWVIQQWQWSPTQEYSLTAVPAGRLIVLDLFADGNPAFDKYNGFAPQDAVFSIIPNFGGRSGLMGRLTNLTDNYFKFKAQYSSIKGIGAAPEAIEQTPVTYDLIFQLPWMNGVKPDVAEWVSNYSIARYGVENEEIKEAWSLLRQGPLNYGADRIQGPVEDVWAAIPNLTATPASTWGKTLNTAGGTYTKERRQMLIDATYKLLSQNEALNFTDGSIYESNYNYDLVEFGGAVLADYAYDLLLGIASAKTSAGNAYEDDATYIARRDAFLQLILDVDAFKGTNLNFRLGKWTQEARDAAQEAIDLGATAATADWYEYNNARTIISTWSSPDATTCLGNFNARDLNDYSYRSWQGMMKDYYLPRWKHFFENGCTNVEYDYFEWNWAHGKEHYVGQNSVSNVALTAGQAGHTDSYTRDPEGNTVEKAIEVLGKYIIPLKTDNGTTYAYRYLTNTLSAEYKVEGAEGGTIDMSKFFLADIDGAIVTGEFINGAVNDIKAVPVKSGIAGNTYDAVMTLTDGTVLNFKVVVNSAEMVTAKEELAALIEKMEALTAQVGSYKSVGTVTDVTERLTTEGTAGTTEFYVWTNAQEDAEGPIKNLVDGDTETHFHSEYSTNVGANHFINVDLGDNNKMSSFRFIYSTRKAETNFPKTIEVSGCNERTGTYEYITTVTNLPAGNSNSVVTYVSDRISCAKEYAYLRFTVTANNSGNKEAGSHPFFHMSEFGLEEVCTTADVIDVYDGTELTDAFAAEKYDVLLAAINVYKTATTPEQIADATTTLQAAYDELQDLVDVQQPEEPVGFNGVYKILYKQNPVFIAYLEGNELLTGANDGAYRLFDSNTDGIDDNQKGYHDDAMEGKVEADALFTIVPNSEATGYTLSAQGMYLKDTYAGWWGASAFSTDKNQAGVYIFEETTVNDLTVYRLKSTTSTWLEYVNDWGIVFGNNDSNDTFATFTLKQVTEYTLTVPANGATTLCLPFNVVLPQGVTAYDIVTITEENGKHKYGLSQVAVGGQVLAKNTPVIIEGAKGDHVLTITMNDEGAKGSTVGTVLRSGLVKTTVDAGNNYTFDGENFNIVTTATEVAANQCWMALTENKGNVVYKEVPETPAEPEVPATLTDGGVYRIKGLLLDGTTYRTVYTNGAGNKLRWTSDEKSDATTLFVAQETADGKFKLVSALGNGLWNNERVLDEDGVGLTLLPGTVGGTFAIRGNGTRVFSAHGGGTSGDMNMYSGGNQIVNENETTNFVFEEVTDANELAKVAYNKIMPKGNYFATMFLPYNVAVPANIKAYTATIDNKDQDQQGVISLDEIANGIIPARTAVILRREDNTATGEFSFKYTIDASSNNYEGNLFGGRVTTGYVGSDNVNERYYLLLNTDTKGEALYKVYREYNSWGGYVGENNGGYIKCEGNKGYMKLDVASGAPSSYSFRFDGSTGVDEVKMENGEVKAIYDLQGRKLTDITKPGFYIVNGSKVFVK